jgi:hypothetical protein
MGIMVSSAGFSKAAYERAAGENISLYKYKDTLNETWPSGLETNVLLQIWELTRLGAQSKFIRGIRKGRIHFEGLVNESQESARQGHVLTCNILNTR